MSYVIVVLGTLLSSVGGSRDARPMPHVYTVDQGASRTYVVVHRAGILSFLGHDHAIVAGAWRAELCLDDPIPQDARASLVIETGSLVIDSDSARGVAGMGGGPGEDDRRDIQTRMLDSEHLDAEQHPEIRLDLHAVEPETDDQVQVEGTIDVRGVTRDVRFPVRIERDADGGLLLTGSARIHLRDYGIEPESRAGVVKVSNDVDLHFALVASPTAEPCGA